MKTCLRVGILFVLGALLASAPVAFASATPDQKRDEIRKTRDAVLTELYKLNPDTKAKIKEAAGYAVFSNVGVNVVLVSAGGGHGIVVKNGASAGSETFMKMGSAGVGLGIGVKDFRAVFIFKSKEKLDTFIEKGWDFSGQADAAAKSEDKGAAAAAAGDLAKDVEVYQLTKSGIALQATLQGTKYWKDSELN